MTTRQSRPVGPRGSTDRLTDLLGITAPVLLAPMARVAGGALTEAVSAAGGLGILGGGYGDPSWLDEQMHLVSTRPFGIGIITWKVFPAMLEHILKFEPAAVWLSFGEPDRHIETIHDAGGLAICQVATTREAERAVDAGVDILVAQGCEAGGHGRLLTPVLELVEAVADAATKIPVVAAGGMTTAADLEAVLARGGSGVAVGTALYATHEALDSDAAKRRLVTATGSDTVTSTVYDHVRGPIWPAGYRGRSLDTALTKRWAGAEPLMESHLDEIRAAYDQAVADDDLDMRVVWAGTGVGKVTSVAPAATIVNRFAPQ